jgi:hypothetical protein
MAYRIFFSGLMAFVEYGGFKEVDVLLLNPCASHHDPGEGKHEGADHERSCLDRHLPQLTVKATDMAEWKLAGTLHGCGSRHFDLTGKTIFPASSKGAVDSTSTPELDTYPVDSFGDMRHVSFMDGIVDMHNVLGGSRGKIAADKVTDLLKVIGKKLIAARVRLPKGKLTALAPLDNSVRQVARWNIGLQKRLLVMCETVMFVPDDQTNTRIDVGDGFVQLKRKPDVAVWITAEPRVDTRFRPETGFPGVSHFEHYYDLLPVVKGARPSPKKPGAHPPKGPVPELDKASFNTDTPPCPECLVHTDNSLG